MARPSPYTLFDVVEAVQAIATHDAEVVATVVSLINSGRVRLCGALAGATVVLPPPACPRGGLFPLAAGASHASSAP